MPLHVPYCGPVIEIPHLKCSKLVKFFRVCVDVTSCWSEDSGRREHDGKACESASPAASTEEVALSDLRGLGNAMKLELMYQKSRWQQAHLAAQQNPLQQAGPDRRTSTNAAA